MGMNFTGAHVNWVSHCRVRRLCAAPTRFVSLLQFVFRKSESASINRRADVSNAILLEAQEETAAASDKESLVCVTSFYERTVEKSL